MDDLKVIFASNLIKLRTEANMTQVDLADKINYSDKSVSKWERAEALPDIAVMKCIAEQFGVTIDFLLNTHTAWDVKPSKKRFSTKMVILVTMVGIWTLAILLFVILWMLNIKVWMILIAAVPVSLITLLVLNTIWHKGKYNLPIVAGVIFGLFIVICYALKAYKPWPLVFVAIPAEMIVFFSFKIKNGLKIGKNTNKSRE